MKKTLTIMICLLVIMPLNAYAGDVGDIAPQFELTDATGNLVSSGSLKAKVVILVFWATWCMQCRTELPELDILYKEYRKEGVEVVAISVDSSMERLSRFLQKIKPSFLVLHDGKGTVADAYHVSGIPEIFIIGRDGRIGRRTMGFGKAFLPTYEQEIQEFLKQP